MSFRLSRDLKLLLLLPALYLCTDFLEQWMLVYFTSFTLIITFFRPYRWLAYLNFITSYFVFKTVGFYIIPETMVPNLSVFILSQFLLNKSDETKDVYLIFLWLGSYALFSSSLYYMIYTFVALILVFLIEEDQSEVSVIAFLKNLWKYKTQFFLIGIITLLLFIFFPRFYQFLPSANITGKGKIGYNKEVDNSNTANLELSSQVAFYAEINSILPQELLYWRGRVLNYTDGYNWRRTPGPVQRIDIRATRSLINQKIKFEQEFNGDLLLLNTPLSVSKSNLRYYPEKMDFTFQAYTKNKKAVIEGQSSLGRIENIALKDQLLKFYLQLPSFIPAELKLFQKEIKTKNPTVLLSNFKRKLLRDQYSYTLSPGALETMGQFLQKKTGYCSHFASLLGIVLRLNNIPARLVSGFQGGQYNDVGNFYLVKSNDAHVWVEYYWDNSWITVDPTGYISPDRINLGGQSFLTAAVDPTEANNSNSFSRPFYAVKSYFDTLNYKVSLFLDNYDRNKQKSLSESLKMPRKAFYLLGLSLVSLVCFMIYFFGDRVPKEVKHPADRLLAKLEKKHKIALTKVKTIKELLAFSSSFSDPKDFQSFIRLYQEVKYGNSQDMKELKIQAKKLRVI